MILENLMYFEKQFASLNKEKRWKEKEKKRKKKKEKENQE